MSEELIKEADSLFESASWQDFRNDRKDLVKVRRLEHKPDIGKLYHDFGLRYSSFETRHASNRFREDLASAAPVMDITALEEDAGARENAQRFEHMMNNHIQLWRRQIVQVCSDQTNAGVGIFKLGLIGASQRWPDLPRPNGNKAKWEKDVMSYKLRRPTPFTLETLNPLCFACKDDAEGNPIFFVERSERPIIPLLKLYGLTVQAGRFAVGPAQERDTADLRDKTVTFTEICTPTNIYHVLKLPGGAQSASHVMTFGNPFGMVRYVVMGVAGENVSEPRWRFEPLIAGPAHSTKNKDFYGTLRALAAWVEAVQIWDVVPKDSEAMPPLLDPRTGKPMQIFVPVGMPMDYAAPPGYEVKLRDARKVDLTEMQNFVEADIQKYGYPDVLAGIGQGEREAAMGLTVRGERAEKQLSLALNSQAEGWKTTARLMGQAIKNENMEVVVRSIITDEDTGKERPITRTVGPNEVDEMVLAVDMHHRATALATIQREEMRRAVFDGFLSGLTYQTEGWGIKDTEAENRQIAREKAQKIGDVAALLMAARETVDETMERDGVDITELMNAAISGATGGQIQGLPAPEPAEERRAATPVRAEGLEAPPTPESQRVL